MAHINSEMLPVQRSRISGVRNIFASLLSSFCLMVSFSSMAAEAALASDSSLPSDVTISGFMSIVGGKVLSGSRSAPFNGVVCPCFISSWGNMGIYNQDVSFKQETRAGVRVAAKLSEELSGVVQVDGRTINGGNTTLEWAYVSYKPAESWEVNVGRKRIPIYYYSDFIDVGFAYPWVRPPALLYGWEVDNFNGATLVKSGHWNNWNSRTSIFYGREESKQNILSNYFYPGVHPDLTWSHILGADLELTHSWFNARLVYIQSNVELEANSGQAFYDGSRYIEGKQRIYGLAINMDYQDWLLRSEFSKFDRWDTFGYRSHAWVAGVGKQVGDFTPMLSYGHWLDDNNYGSPVTASANIYASLRYDLDSTSALKFQYDIMRELSSPDSTSGDAKMLSVAFDKVF